MAPPPPLRATRLLDQVPERLRHGHYVNSGDDGLQRTSASEQLRIRGHAAGWGRNPTQSPKGSWVKILSGAPDIQGPATREPFLFPL
jgi:hypothetical protein